jgi:hypothetical protein
MMNIASSDVTGSMIGCCGQIADSLFMNRIEKRNLTDVCVGTSMLDSFSSANFSKVMQVN